MGGPKSVGDRYTRRGTKSPRRTFICPLTRPQVMNWKLSGLLNWVFLVENFRGVAVIVNCVIVSKICTL